MATKKPGFTVTGTVRFAYVNVFSPKASEEGKEPKYSVCIIIPKKDKDTIAKIEKAIEEAVLNGGDKTLRAGKPYPNLKRPLRDGDEERPDRPEFANSYFMNLNSFKKPGVVDDNVNAIIDVDEFYSGCYGRASVQFYAYENKGSRGIAAGLNNLQKLEDGERLAGGSSAEDDFAL